MEENKLKEFWDEVHTDIEISRVDIKEVIHKKHCNVISRMLRRQKTLIVLFAIFSFSLQYFSIFFFIFFEDLSKANTLISATSSNISFGKLFFK